MVLVVIGAGPIGWSFTEIALADGHDVVLIEPDEKRAEAAAQRFDARVLHADVSEGGILEEAGAGRADALVATTDDDASNLMAIFLAHESGMKTLVSVVNDRAHQRLFDRLGVHVLVDPDVILAKHLYAVVREPKLEDVVSLPAGGQVFEITVARDAPVSGRTLSEAREADLFGGTMLVVSVLRGEEHRIPSGDTRIEAGDHLTIFSREAVTEKQLRAFTGGDP